MSKTTIYYYSDFDQVTDSVLDEMTSWMSQQQQELIASLHTPMHKREQALAYAMLCLALREGFDGQQGVVRCGEELFTAGAGMERLPLWRVAEHGKPFLTNYVGVYFNISHCSRAVAVAMSHQDVGVDVEGRRRFSDGLLARSMSQAEQAAVRGSADPEATFARLWTRKEAYFKWLGTGILITRLPHTESDAQEEGCAIETQYVERDAFFLSVAFKKTS